MATERVPWIHVSSFSNLKRPSEEKAVRQFFGASPVFGILAKYRQAEVDLAHLHIRVPPRIERIFAEHTSGMAREWSIAHL